jgi:transcriptional regulator with XRE-family HTH domain
MQLNGHALRIIRERSGLTVSALAELAGISQPHLSNIERGRRMASPEVAARLAEVLRVPLVALLAEPGAPAPSHEQVRRPGTP